MDIGREMMSTHDDGDGKDTGNLELDNGDIKGRDKHFGDTDGIRTAPVVLTAGGVDEWCI